MNPEFERQLYLEYSSTRLIAIPLILSLILGFGYVLDDYQLADKTAQTALVLFILTTLIWGPRQTIDSIVDEFREKTWDTQRLSALGPWQMTWGKLLGSTAMVWYCGAICLFVHVLASQNAGGLPWLLAFCLLIAITAQSVGLLIGLLAVQRGDVRTGSLLALTVIAFLIVAPQIFRIADWDTLSSFHNPWQRPSPTLWWQQPFDSRWFRLISLSLAGFWSVLGCYRLMARELGMRPLPHFWLAFLLFMMIYLGGFMPDSLFSWSATGFFISVASVYIALLAERNDAMTLQRFISHCREKRWQRAAETLPLWLLGLAVALPAAVVASAADMPFEDWGIRFHIYPIAALLLVMRDCLLYLGFTYGKHPQRALNLTLLTLALLDMLLPGLFTTLSMGWLAAAAFPLLANQGASAMLLAACHTGVAGYWCFNQWRSRVAPQAL